MRALSAVEVEVVSGGFGFSLSIEVGLRHANGVPLLHDGLFDEYAQTLAPVDRGEEVASNEEPQGLESAADPVVVDVALATTFDEARWAMDDIGREIDTLLFDPMTDPSRARGEP